MLPKANRLTKKKEFDAVFKQGRSNYTKIIGIKTTSNDLGLVRMGVLVGNKISKKATDRNKIKRRIRDVFQSEINNLSPGNDFVVIALAGSLEKNFSELEASIKSSLKKLFAYKKNA